MTARRMGGYDVQRMPGPSGLKHGREVTNLLHFCASCHYENTRGNMAVAFWEYSFNGVQSSFVNIGESWQV